MLSASRRMRRCLVLLLAPLLLLAGCVKFDTSMELKDENHIHLKATVGISKSMVGMSGGNLPPEFSDCSNSKESAGVGSSDKAEKLEDEEYIGCTFTKDTTAAELNKEPGMKVTFDEDEVSAQVSSDLFRDSGRSGEAIGATMFSDFKVSVTFPGKVVSHSGSSTVDGNTVTWTDPKDLFSSSGLTAASKRSNGIPAWIWIGAAVVGLAIAGAVVVIVSKKKGPKATQPEDDDAPWAMQYLGDGRLQGQSQPPQGSSQQDSGQPWGNQPWGYASGDATSAPQPGQDPVRRQGSQPGWQSPSDPDDFWKSPGSH